MGRKKKELDQLTIDSNNAIKAGMSYGKYMALKKPATITEPVTRGIKHTCQGCGKEFLAYTRKARKFCCDSCREAYYRKVKKMEADPETVEKTCPICGKVFIAENYRYRYCSEFCKKVGQGQRVKEYQERKKEAMA